MRLDADGVPHMLEINANCGVYYPPTDPGTADIILAHDPAGHVGFTRQLVRAALSRRRVDPAPPGERSEAAERAS